jgi:hypothetical protein
MLALLRIVVLWFLASRASAQTGSLDMLNNVQDLQKCMNSVGIDQMQRLAQQARQMGSEINALCTAGRKDEAVKRALTFAQQITHDPAMQKLSACSSGLAAQFSAIPGLTSQTNSANIKNQLCSYTSMLN